MFTKNDKLYLPAAAGDKMFYSVSFHKPAGRPAYVSSLLVKKDNGFITYIIDFKKKAGETTQYINGAATAKKVDAAFQSVIAYLQNNHFTTEHAQ